MSLRSTKYGRYSLSQAASGINCELFAMYGTPSELFHLLAGQIGLVQQLREQIVCLYTYVITKE